MQSSWNLNEDDLFLIATIKPNQLSSLPTWIASNRLNSSPEILNRKKNRNISKKYPAIDKGASNFLEFKYP